MGIMDIGTLDMSAGLVALTLFGTFILLMVTGLPIIFAMGSTAIIFIFLLMGPKALGLLASRAWDGVDTPILVCLPMFVFMGMMLERSGVANNLYTAMHKWAGPLRGGLAAGTVLICMIMAAMTGLSAAATLTMGLTALPEMLNRGYDKSIALGCIGAGGALGILIPPSVTMVIYALVAQASVGQLFIGGIFPGIILGSLFMSYIFARAFLQPKVAPALPREERASWPEKWKSLVHVLLPIFIIMMVLGSIFFGVATPTEASAVGALGTIIAAAVNKKLNVKSLKETCFGTARVCGMAMWMLVGALGIKSISFSVGAGQYIHEMFAQLPGGIWGIIITMQAIWLVLGCLLDPIGILFITGPIFIPLVVQAGFSPVWFGIVFVVNMEMAYLTPPFGMNIFYLKGVAPPSVTMGDIYKSIGPFVGLQLVCLALVMIFPQLVLWLPGLMISR